MRRLLLVTALLNGALGCSDADAPEAPERTEQTPAAQLVDAGARAPSVLDAAADRAARSDAGQGDSGTKGAPCKDADLRGTPAELHAAAATVLTATTPCGFSACHQGSRAKAGLRLGGVTDLRAYLVDKPACESSTLPLVKSGGGEGGLANSWLWVKLTSPVDAAGALPNDARFGAVTNCGQSGSEPYGQLMPLGAGMLEEIDLAPIRNWICAGAPGPQ